MTVNSQSQPDYTVQARSTDTFGRVLVSARDQHLVVDGPKKNGCPGEAMTPAELFLGGVASCAVELVQVIAREIDVEVGSVTADIAGVVARDRDVRPDVTVFSSVALRFAFSGVGDDAAARLVEAFKGR